MTEREPGVDEGHEHAAGAAGTPAADDAARSDTPGTPSEAAQQPASSLSGDDLFAAAAPSAPVTASPVVSMKPGPAQPPAAPARPAESAADGSALSGPPVEQDTVAVESVTAEPEVPAARSESAAAWAGANDAPARADAPAEPVAAADVAPPASSAAPAGSADDDAVAPADDDAPVSEPVAAPVSEAAVPASAPVAAEPVRPEPAAEPVRDAAAAETTTRREQPEEPVAAPAHPEPEAPVPAAQAPAAHAPDAELPTSAAEPVDRRRGWFDPERDTEATAVLPAMRPATPVVTPPAPTPAVPAPVEPPRPRQAGPVDPATVRIPARRTEQQVERPTEVIPAIAAESPRREAPRRPDQAEGPTTLTKVAAAAAGAGPAVGAAAGRTATVRTGAAGEGLTTPVTPGAGVTRPVPPEADSGGDGPDGPDAPGSGSKGRGRRRPLLVALAVVGLLAVLYVVDLLLGMGDMPRGVSVAGQAVGGMSREEAEASLRATIDPRSTQPVVVTAGDVRTEIEADTAKLGVDWGATMERAGAQPLNPIARVQSFFVDKDFDIVGTADDKAVAAALEGMGPLVDDDATEASVRFDGLEPVPVMPEDGHRLDVPAAVPLVSTKWATGQPVELPLVTLKPVTTADDVRQVVDSIARPAVSAPITVTGEGAQGTLDPADIAKALTFRADAAATPRLVPELNPEVVSDALSPQLEKTEKPGRDATLDISGPTPVVVPSQDGRGIDYPATLTTMVPVLTAQAPRQVAAVYGDKPAKVTTEDIQKLGIAGEISTFTTGGFAADSGRNIKRAAEQIDGTIVKPGETFSLNAKTNPRNAANGYVEAGIIEDGHPARGIGGGVSQVATTLYNAAYFAGMVDVAHKEHSFYISRYPAAREATVFDDIIDLKFRNDGPTGVLIKTFWTPTSLTIKIYGTKRYEVTSTTGPRTNETPPSPVTIPAGQPCSPSSGAPGFTATDTRTLRNVQTGEVRTERRTVRYNPSPIVVCGG